jgi:AraC family transcriptional regulator
VDSHANSHLMPNDKSSQLDFITDYPEYGVRQPLLASGDDKWNGFSLEHHLQPQLEMSEHYHTEHMISIYLDRQPNQLEIGMDENHQDVLWQPGDIFIVPAYVNHALAWGHNSEFMMLCIKPDLFTQSLNEIVDSNSVDLIPQFTKPDALIYQLGLTLKADLETGVSGSRLYTDAISNTLLMHLFRYYCIRNNIAEYPGKLTKIELESVVNYIHEYLDRDISLTELAAIVQMGSRHFSRCFKKSTGFSPYQYLIKCRVDKAKELLQQKDSSIAKIAQAVGFANQSHLSRHFKRWIGVSPKSVQKR